ncbi:MAG: hypothetical protein ACOC0C_07235 [Bacteroidota bacterium]
MNRHVNSNRYIDCMLNTSSTNFLNTHQISDLQLHFKKEVLPDARLSINMENPDDNLYLFEGQSVDGRVVHFQAKIIFLNPKKHN